MKYFQSNPQLANMFHHFPSVYLQNGSTSPLSLPVTWTVCHTNSKFWRSIWI